MGRKVTAFSMLAIGLLAFTIVSQVQARDGDKELLYNTFFLETPVGSFELKIAPDRNFLLKAPGRRGAVTTGQIWATDEEVGFFAGPDNRHFSFDFRNGDLILTATKKDKPDPATMLGTLPPLGRGNSAVFTAIQNRRVVVAPPPVVVAPPPVVEAPPVVVLPPERGRDWDRDRDRDRDHDHRGRGHWETRREQVLVSPERVEQRYVPAVTETRADRFGHVYTIEVAPAHFENVAVPAQYEWRNTQVWVRD